MGIFFKALLIFRKLLEGVRKPLVGKKHYFEIIALVALTACAAIHIVVKLPPITLLISLTLFMISLITMICNIIIKCLKKSPVLDSGAIQGNSLRTIIDSLFIITVGTIKIKIKGPSYGPKILPAKSDEDIVKISRINTERFRNNEIFSDEYEQKYNRNRSMWDRNSRVFMTVRNSGNLHRALSDEHSENDILFFSHFIPLNKIGYDEYFTDKIAGDREFRDYWVAKADEKTVAILAFTIASKASLIADISQGMSSTLWANYINCMHAHLYDLLSNVLFEGDSLPVYLQTDDNSIIKIAKLAKMAECNKRTRDGLALYRTNVSLLSSEPQAIG